MDAAIQMMRNERRIGEHRRTPGPNGADFHLDFTLAFQPIVDASRGEVRAYKAMVRGVNGEGAQTVLQQVTGDAISRFDQACRVRAIRLASKLGLEQQLFLNFMPNAVRRPTTWIDATLDVARAYGFDRKRLVFESTESETLASNDHLVEVIDAHRERGCQIAIDDYGEGYSRINLLTRTCPHYLKLDASVVRDCDRDPARQALIEGTLLSMSRLGIETIAEGVETEAEYAWCRSQGINLFRGHLLARPGFETLPAPYIPRS